jgi:hypothetical protein
MMTLSTIGRTEPRSRNKTERASANTAVEVASYIADLSESLARTARENGLSILAHLLDMAREEAAATAAKSAETSALSDR